MTNAQNIEQIAKQQFECYKKQITEEFVDTFGASYQTPADCQDWTKVFKYTPECADFIKHKTKVFIRMLPVDNNEVYQNPKFLNILIQNICDYLSHYTRRESQLPLKQTNRNIYKDDLFHELFVHNEYVQKQIEKYVNRHHEQWAILQKEKHAKAAKKEKMIKKTAIKKARKRFIKTGEISVNINLLLHTDEQLRAKRIEVATYCFKERSRSN